MVETPGNEAGGTKAGANRHLLLATRVVTAFVGRNAVPSGALAGLIREVVDALRALDGPHAAPEEARPEPAVPIRKSVHPDYIVCLEDGKQFKALKRHLQSHYNMTPQQYRQRWGLPSTYPMVAPNYAKSRSQLAKQSGLGLKRAMKRG